MLFVVLFLLVFFDVRFVDFVDKIINDSELILKFSYNNFLVNGGGFMIKNLCVKMIEVEGVCMDILNFNKILYLIMWFLECILLGVKDLGYIVYFNNIFVMEGNNVF